MDQQSIYLPCETNLTRLFHCFLNRNTLIVLKEIQIFGLQLQPLSIWSSPLYFPAERGEKKMILCSDTEWLDRICSFPEEWENACILRYWVSVHTRTSTLVIADLIEAAGGPVKMPLCLNHVSKQKQTAAWYVPPPPPVAWVRRGRCSEGSRKHHECEMNNWWGLSRAKEFPQKFVNRLNSRFV